MNKAAFAAGIPRFFGPLGAIAEERESFDRSGEEALHTGPYGTRRFWFFRRTPRRLLPRVNRER
jgi:hypothetical protein